MPRVSSETLEKLEAFIDSLPAEARGKCALCTETLTHIVKTAEVETGAGTATVTRVLSEKINETAAPADRVSEQALRRRVQRNEEDNRPKRADTPPAAGTNKQGFICTETNPVSDAMRFASARIAQLESIKKDDPKRADAFRRVKTWLEVYAD